MRKRLVTMFAALAAIAGLVVGGTALAGGSGSTTPSAQEQPATTDADSVQDENGADDATEPAGSEQGGKEDGDQTQDPSYTGSITTPETDGASEADEAKALEALATISPDQASQAALAAVPGTVDKVELDNENGSVVYSVEVKTADGKLVDVKVDAGNGTVLAQEADGNETGEGSEQSEGAEEPEGAEQPESAEPGTATNG